MPELSRPLLVRTAGTLLLAAVAGWACATWRVPLPWMLGPLLATAAASMGGAPTFSVTPLRNLAQMVIGTALGLYFTPQVMVLVGRLWWAIVLGIVWALVIGWLFGRWLHAQVQGRLPGTPAQQRATSYFAGAIGGASEMTLLAERAGARTDLVAAAHSLRLLIVTLTLPVLMTVLDLHGSDPFQAGAKVVDWGGLVLLFAGSGVGAWVLARTGRANPWFLGALVVSMATAMADLRLSAMPQVLSNAAQLVIGVSLGVRFRAEFVHTAPRWLAAVGAGTLGMLAICALFAWALAWATGLPVPTLVLGTSPGGIAEMAITAKVLQLGVPVVTAFQVCRLVAVLLLVEPLYRRGWLS